VDTFWHCKDGTVAFQERTSDGINEGAEPIPLERAICTLCMFFARRLRIFKAVEPMEIYQIPLFPRPVGSSLIVGEPAVRSRLRVEVSVHEIVAMAALPEPPVVEWHPGDGSQNLLQSLVRFHNVHPIEI
jgi:hypothetical protein